MKEPSLNFTDKQKVASLLILENLANIDGYFDNSEKAIINSFSKFLQFDVKSVRALDLFREMRNSNIDELVQIIKPLSREGHGVILMCACELSAADGCIDETENKALGNLCIKLGISPKEFDKMQKRYLKLAHPKSGCFSIILVLIISTISLTSILFLT
ncbi:tellurite resistance TerB family protein [Bacteroidales bacterium OttesenSCG-928-M11]|nr:tellurite resistance TerB family protein [Bacteroidales bacterium OttesenSCG-928-M11]